MKIDTRWFHDQIKASPYGSLRKVAAKMQSRRGGTMDISNMSRMLQGKKPMQLFEARALSSILNIPVAEILRRAGLDFPEEGAKTFPVMGVADAKGAVHMEKKPIAELAGPWDLPVDAFAVRFQAPHWYQDGWTLFAEKAGPVKGDHNGRLCIAGYNVKARVAVVTRGYKKGTFNLSPWCGEFDQIANIHLDWVAAVLWVRP